MRTKHPLVMTVYIAFLVAVGPLSTDMYLPALPGLAVGWGVSESLANLSLSLWFASYAVTLLVYGPLSDKHGRRPIIFTGLAVFLAGSLGCSLSVSMPMLIGFRMVQAAGGAAASAMAMAISRDLFDGAERQKVLAYVGVILAVAPMIAPSLGSLFLEVASWRFIFAAQACWALAAGAVTLAVPEPLAPENRNAELRFLSRYAGLAKNRTFLLSTFLLCVVLGPFYGHIAASPHIYILTYGLSESAFSGYFALNALAMMIGALACARLSHRVSPNKLNAVGFAGVAAGGAGILAFNALGPLGFALPMMAVTLFMGVSRPAATNLVLEQVDTDIGSASSFLIFCQFLVGALFMASTSLGLIDSRDLLGGMTLVLGLAVLAAWPILLAMIRRRGAGS